MALLALPQRFARGAAVILVTLTPLLLGLPLLAWQAERNLQAQAQQTANAVLKRLTVIVDNAANAARALAPLAGQHCSSATLALREQVTRNPYVRSTSLVNQGQAYCSSLYGPVEEVFSQEGYADGRLRLFAADTVTPGRALLIYRESSTAGSALATVDGQHLANLLVPADADETLVLQVGDSWMQAEGVVHQGVPADFTAGTTLTSPTYPLRLHAGFAEGAAWNRVWAAYATLALLAALGLAAGAICYWLQRRAGSQRQELLRALTAGEFVPFFQPVVTSTTGACTGAEVLMRWQHPREGLVRPDLFIPYAEANGLIIPMTRHLMQQTAAALLPLAPALDDGFHIGINIAAAHFRDPSLVMDCQRFIDNFPPGRIQLVLELTERELVVPAPETLAIFAQLRNMGVRIALDDFGTGHSSLSYLHQFSMDYLKIDRSFVTMIGSQALGRHILDSIIELCAKLNLDVVAEGVETLEQQQYLAEQGVAYLQGYLFAKPMPAEAFASYARGGSQETKPALASVASLG